MSQSLSRILVHLIFSTKNRERFLTPEIGNELHPYLATVLREDGCPSLQVGGVEDHVHLLFGLSRTRTVAQVVETVKTRSSRAARGTNSFTLGERPSVRLPRRTVPICVSEPIGFARPLRMASTPATKVVATAPMPGIMTPSLPFAGSIVPLSAFFGERLTPPVLAASFISRLARSACASAVSRCSAMFPADSLSA